MRTYFITGLPRSRTAWLANLLTHGDSFCFHEACRQVEHVDELPALLASAGSPNAGTADCGFPLYYDQALALLPESHIVVVRRSRADCEASYVALLKEKLQASPVLVAETFDQVEENFAAMVRALGNRHVLEVAFDDLSKRKTIQAIWEHCTGHNQVNWQRWQMLEDLQINVIPKRVVDNMRLEKLRAIFKPAGRPAAVVSSVATPAMVQFHQAILNFCQSTPGAFPWVSQLWEVLLTWDHIVDRDVIDSAMASRAFEALIFAWAENPFWQANYKFLLPGMSAALSAWRHSAPGEKHYDAYTEVPCAMAYLIGGTPLVGRVMPQIRQLASVIRAENEKAKA